MNEQYKQRSIIWDSERRIDSVINVFPPLIQQTLLYLDAENALEFPDEEISSAYIYGENGVGKTTKAVLMIIQEKRFCFLNKQPLSFIFINIPELLLKFRSTFSDDSEETEQEILERYTEVDLLVLDDFGVEKITDWSFQMLYILINRRYEYMKKTIYTSNFNLEQLAEKLGDDRIPSRIQEACEEINLKGKNFRSKL